MKKTIATILAIILTIIAGFAIYYVISLQEKPEESGKIIDKTKNENKVNDEAPKEDEPYENETTLVDKYGSSEEKEEVELKYDQYIIASGYAGASDNVYYTRNGVLYHMNISTEQTTKLAEGVKSIESDLDGMKAYKGKNFKIIKEDNYITYVD